MKINVEHLARAWAAIDGKLIVFNREKEQPYNKDDTGTYEGYMSEAESLIERYEYEVKNNESK